LTFLQERDVITLDFQMRFMKQQEKDGDKYFACPAQCGRYLIDMDPEYAVVPRGSREVDGFERVMKLGKCECGARVCVKCHLEAEPSGIKRAMQKLAEVTKEDVEALEKEGGVDYYGDLDMTEVAGMIGLKAGDKIKVQAEGAAGQTALLEATLDHTTRSHLMVKFTEGGQRKLESLSPDISQLTPALSQLRLRGAVDLKQVMLLDDEHFVHECAPELKRQLSTDKATLDLMNKIGKHCPNCGAFVQKNGGCNIMMCGTTAHGRLADALAHGGCGHLFHWDSLKPAKTFYVGLDGNRVDNYVK